MFNATNELTAARSTTISFILENMAINTGDILTPPPLVQTERMISTHHIRETSIREMISSGRTARSKILPPSLQYRCNDTLRASYHGKSQYQTL